MSEALGSQQFSENKFSTLGLYATLIGYSWGSSDFWRFSFLVYRNGGGAFLIPFVITMMICGIPLYFLEYSMAKFSGRGPYAIWDMCPLFRGAGIAVVVAYMFYISGSSIMRCWLFGFLVNTFQDPLPWSSCNNEWNSPNCRRLFEQGSGSNTSGILQNLTKLDEYLVTTQNASGVNVTNLTSSAEVMTPAEEFWQYKILELSPGIEHLYPFQWRYALYMVLLRVAVFFLILKSIKWLEKAMYVTTTVPIILTLVIFVRSLTLPGCGDGIYHFFKPDFSALLSIKIWIEAALMAFYTLAFGWGTVVMMASHAKFTNNSIRTAIFVPMLDMCLAIFCGLVSFSVLGNMAHSYGTSVTEVINAGMSVGVVSYVTALESFPLPQFWSACFFIAVIITGLDEQMIPIEMTIEVIGDMFPKYLPKHRIPTLFGLSVLLLLCALPTCTGAGGYLFLWTDWYSGVWVGPIVAMLELLVVGWLYGLERFSDDLIVMHGRPIPAVLRIILAYITPVIVFALFVVSILWYEPPTYGPYSYPVMARIVGWISVVIILFPLISKAISNIRQTKGTLSQRLKILLRTEENWGPCDKQAAVEYEYIKTKYKKTSFMDKLTYNITGRRRKVAGTHEHPLMERGSFMK